MSWMIYGAYGYTGRLLVEEALRRGLRPVIAGRSREQVEALAFDRQLPWRAFSLDDPRAVREGIEGQALVFHAAGPFVHTAAPMVEACLEAGVHYVDVTGELPVFAHVFSKDDLARDRGVCLLSGAGFDVVPSDCLAKYVAEKVPGATSLELGIAGAEQASAGTTRSVIEAIPRGGLVRRGGNLQAFPFGHGATTVRFADRSRKVLPIPWGDLETAWHSTGIPDITTYMAQPPGVDLLLRATGPLLQRALAADWLRERVARVAAGGAQGPDAEARLRGRSHFWARARRPDGSGAEAWLEAPEAYALTATAGIRIVERLLAHAPAGAHSPAMAFGADFVLDLPGTERLDQLPG